MSNDIALRLADLLERRGYATLTTGTRLVDREIAAELRRLHAENDELRSAMVAAAEEINELRSVMVAAAEEIAAHWDAHCNEEGYGPSNLMHRLEEGIPSQYSYTAGAFADLQRQRSALLEALKDAAECIESWGSYASEYFQDKHDLAGDIDRIQSAIAKAEEKK